MTKLEDDELDGIAHRAAEQAYGESHEDDLPWKVRIALLVAALVVIANTLIGVFNTIALKQEVACNHQLQTALSVVSDQSRNINKQLFDTVLSGRDPKTHKLLTRADLVTIDKEYDRAFNANTRARNQLLAVTCSNGSTKLTPVSPSLSPSLTTK